MTKLEKVINGLEAHGKHTCTNNDGKVCPYFIYGDCSEMLADDALELLAEQQPTVDAVPVVRCKDCIHRFSEITPNGNVVVNICELGHNCVQPDDWFCADGERRED